MINTRNLKDIGKLNVYEIVRKLKGVRKKNIDICMLICIILPFMAFQGNLLLWLLVSAGCSLNNGMGDQYIKQMASLDMFP